MLVDFMMIGAQKSGTTSLANQLAQHPQICFCRTKEPGYFNTHEDWQPHLADYHALYTPQPGQLCGEASTMYTFLPDHLETHTRLHAYNPALKLIYIMRQPVARVISNYTHNLVRNLDTRPPAEAVFADPGYINRSRYGVQIRPYLDLFGRENVLLLLFEEYVQDQPGTLAQIADFIGVDRAGLADIDYAAGNQSVGEYYLKYEGVEKFAGSNFFQSVRDRIPAAVRQPVRRLLSNKLEEKPDFSPELRREIWRWVEDDVTEIERLLGRRLDRWRRDYPAPTMFVTSGATPGAVGETA